MSMFAEKQKQNQFLDLSVTKLICRLWGGPHGLESTLNIMRYDSKSLGRKFVIDIVGYRPERRQAIMFVTYAVQNRMDASRFLKWLQVWT